jgi:hypothetical protein
MWSSDSFRVARGRQVEEVFHLLNIRQLVRSQKVVMELRAGVCWDIGTASTKSAMRTTVVPRRACRQLKKWTAMPCSSLSLCHYDPGPPVGRPEGRKFDHSVAGTGGTSSSGREISRCSMLCVLRGGYNM